MKAARPANFIFRFWGMIRNTPRIFLAKTTPAYVKVLLAAGLAYCVSPWDIIPEWVPVVGLLDDLGLAALLIGWASTYAKDEAEDGQTGQDTGSATGSGRQYASPEARYADILGVSPNADFMEIKKAYHQKVKEYHPDRTNGLAEENRQLAARKMKEMNEAFSYFERRSGGR